MSQHFCRPSQYLFAQYELQLNMSIDAQIKVFIYLYNISYYLSLAACSVVLPVDIK